MGVRRSRPRPSWLLLLAILPAPAAAGDWSGYVALEGRYFPHDALCAGQGGSEISLSFEPEYVHEWDDGYQSLRFTGFVRASEQDDERTHGDIRELYYLKAARGWELGLGIRKIFWGVTESQHLVDIINQTDLVEDPDTEVKLGQPMADLTLIRSWGVVRLFLLPGFRERTFPGPDGRLRTAPHVATGDARYESGAERGHLDWAVRWSHVLGPWDIGVAHFQGTGREPRLTPAADDGGDPVLIPFYEQIDQTSLDLQATAGAWLWKLEAISRQDARERFLASTAGFEYTFSDVSGSGIDVGVLAEHLFDDRGDRASSAFEDDVFVGSRLTFNDVQSTDLLVGAVVDLGSGARFLNVEASRRLGESWKLTLRARGFASIPSDDPLYSVRRDDYVQVDLARYF